MILQRCDDTTGEFKVFSSLTGELVYDAVIKDHELQGEIVTAIRKAENIACGHIRRRLIQRLE